MKKEVWILVVPLLILFTIAFFIGGGITGFITGEEPHYKVVISLKDSEPLLAGAVVADVSSDKDKINLMKVKVKAAQEEVIDGVNGGGLFSFFKDDDLIVERQYDVVPAMVAYVTEEGLLDLLNNPLVEGVYSDYAFSVGLSDSVPLINASIIDQFNVSGEGIGVCVIDTGIDTDHPAFSDRIVAQKCFCSNDCCPNGQPEDDDAEDDNVVSHGTHVSGIIASNGSVKGVAPKADLISVKACNNQGTCFTSDIIAGIDFCVQKKSDYNISIISGSFGDGGQHTPATCPSFIDAALDAANSVGLFLIFASGNNAYTNGINYPACYDDAVSVGATTKSDSMASFSNRGPGLDLLAPGASIYSTKIGGYGSLSGTSQATPHVSGFISVLLEFAAKYNLSRQDVVDSLNVTDVFVEGFPRINVGMALGYLFSLANITRGNATNATDNHAPFINISSPVNGSQVFNPVIFNATAFDLEDGSLNVSWFFENNTYFDDFILNLSFKNYSVNVLAKDSENLSTNMTIFFEVIDQTGPQNLSNNSAPVVEILTPSNNSFVGKNVALIANVSDEENVSGSWHSSIQAFLGDGNKLNVSLTDGTHVITFSVTDSGNLTETESIVLHVGNCLIDFDRNSNTQLDIGDVVILFNEFLNNSLTDTSGAFCSQSGTCLFEFDQNNNAVYDIGDIVLLFNGFLNNNITKPSGENCFP